jgi:hypothetical protein
MSRELTDFSNQIDEQVEFEDVEIETPEVLSYIMNLFV